MFTRNDLPELHDKYEFVAYAVKDLKSGSYSVPSFWRSSADAFRAFESNFIAQFAAQAGVYFSHPHDFVLCVVGGYNADSGVLEPVDAFSVRSGYEVTQWFDLECNWTASPDERWDNDVLGELRRYGTDVDKFVSKEEGV